MVKLCEQSNHDLEIAYLSICARCDVPRDIFFRFFENWETYPVYVEGLQVGSILMDGPEIHACILPNGFGRWFTKKVYRDVFLCRLKIYGKLITSVSTNNSIGNQFVKRLGFRAVKSENNIIYYELSYGH